MYSVGVLGDSDGMPDNMVRVQWVEAIIKKNVSRIDANNSNFVHVEMDVISSIHTSTPEDHFKWNSLIKDALSMCSSGL